MFPRRILQILLAGLLAGPVLLFSVPRFSTLDPPSAYADPGDWPFPRDLAPISQGTGVGDTTDLPRSGASVSYHDAGIPGTIAQGPFNAETSNAPTRVHGVAESTAGPTVTAVSPTEAYNFRPTTVSIIGANFVPTPTVTLGNLPLSDATFVNSSTLTATVPAHLPGGTYSIGVVNPDAQSASLSAAFTVWLSGDGSLGSWQATRPMSSARDWPAAIQAAGFLYVLGGGYPNFGGLLSSGERAAIAADGSLGPWEATTSMLTARSVLAVVHAGGYLYALGGWGGASSVERARINADGSLGPWQATTSMTLGRQGLAAVAARGYIYALGGGSFTSSVERAAINADGSLGSWQSTSSMTAARGYLAVVVVGGYLYAIGGQNSTSASLRSVERAAINADGSLGSWEAVSSMVKSRCDLAAAALRGYIYAFGGSTCQGVYYASVERAKVNPDGSLDPWEGVGSMNGPRWRLAAAYVDPYVYVIGGEDDTYAALNSVERAEINPPSLGGLTPSFAPADRTTAIVITGTNLLPPPTLRLGDATVSATFVSTTTLTATVPVSLPTGWYTATLTSGDGRVAYLPNALWVDGTGPTASKLDINGGALDTVTTTVAISLSASDATDTAADLSARFSNDGLAWSDWQAYFATPVTWSLASGDGPKTVYGQVRDRATNVSTVVSDTINLDTSVKGITGVSINDGTLFTNQVTVTLSLPALTKVSEMIVSNDGAFAGAFWEPFSVYRSWQITQYGSYVIPRTVYVKYKDVNGNVSATYQDDIILDATAPSGSVSIEGAGGAARVGSRESRVEASMPHISVGGAETPPQAEAGGTTRRAGGSVAPDFSLANGVAATAATPVILHLSATDDVSGVAGMMVSNSPAFSGSSWETYRATKSWSLESGGKVYVAFKDNAGNASPIYAAALSGTKESLPSAVLGTVHPKIGGTLASSETGTSVAFPAGAVQAKAEVTLIPAVESTQQASTGELRGMGKFMTLTAKAGETPVTTVSQPYTITVSYTAADVVGIDESTLAIYWWNGSAWQKESGSRVDTVAKTVSAALDHLSAFAVLGQSSTRTVYLPLVIKSYGSGW